MVPLERPAAVIEALRGARCQDGYDAGAVAA